MAWIESHQELGHHPKLKKLCRILDISQPQAVGHLQFLWWWSLDYCDDGDLGRFDALDIALGSMWEGDPDAFLDALARCGWIDLDSDTRRIHDWEQYTGKLLDQRRANRDRQRRFRDAKRDERDSNGYVAVTEGLRNPATVPYLTVPNQTEPTETPNVVSVEATPKSGKRLLPKDWEPTPTMIADAAEKHGTSLQQLTDKTEGFRDWANANGHRRLDWDATWRNFMRPSRFDPYPARPNGHAANGRPDFAAMAAKLRAEEETR